MTAKIAVAVGTHLPSKARAEALIQRSFHESAEIERLVDLAGPNDTLQILLEWTWWQQLIVGALATYGSGLLAQAGSDTWAGIKALAMRLVKRDLVVEPTALILELSDITTEARSAGNSVILGLYLDKRLSSRNVGIEITTSSPEEILQVAATLAVNGEALSIAINDLISNNYEVEAVGSNSDLSCKIQVNADGSSEVRLNVKPSQHSGPVEVRVFFGADGKEVERRPPDWAYSQPSPSPK